MAAQKNNNIHLKCYHFIRFLPYVIIYIRTRGPKQNEMEELLWAGYGL